MARSNPLIDIFHEITRKAGIFGLIGPMNEAGIIEARLVTGIIRSCKALMALSGLAGRMSFERK